MANTYFLISSVTVGSGGSASMSFTSIPATYTDLLIRISSRATSTTPEMSLTFNSSSSNQTDRVLYNYGGAAGSNPSTSLRISCSMSSQTANTFGSADIYVPNYAISNNKSISVDSVSESNETSNAYAYINAGLWTNTAAITSVTLTPASGNFAQYSTATLYGIKSS